MALTNGNNFIFIHIYKCGGMSLRKALSDNTTTLEINNSHATAQEVKDYYYNNGGQFIWNHSFKFSFVRNPFDWVVSLYEFIRTNETHENYNEVKDMDFEEFCQWNVYAISNNKQNTNGKLNTLTSFLFDDNGTLLVDFVGRFENFDADFEVIAKRLNLYLKDINLVNIPHINKSNREPDYRKYYNEKSKEIITNGFYHDLVNFNYQF